MKPETLDHVALWVSGRDAVADAVTAELDVHVIERTDRFTLLGADARRGKLTLFDAEGPRDRGVLKHVALRMQELPDGPRTIELPEGLELRLVQADGGQDYDLDHVALVSAFPEHTARAWEAFGLQPAGAARVEVGGAFVEFHQGEVAPTDRPLLNHVAFLVDSVNGHVAEAEQKGIEILDVVDAPNTLALFVQGPDGVKLEYVEHKPGFSLA